MTPVDAGTPAKAAFNAARREVRREARRATLPVVSAEGGRATSGGEEGNTSTGTTPSGAFLGSTRGHGCPTRIPATRWACRSGGPVLPRATAETAANVTGATACSTRGGRSRTATSGTPSCASHRGGNRSSLSGLLRVDDGRWPFRAARIGRRITRGAIPGASAQRRGGKATTRRRASS